MHTTHLFHISHVYHLIMVQLMYVHVHEKNIWKKSMIVAIKQTCQCTKRPNPQTYTYTYVDVTVRTFITSAFLRIWANFKLPSVSIWWTMLISFTSVSSTSGWLQFHLDTHTCNCISLYVHLQTLFHIRRTTGHTHTHAHVYTYMHGYACTYVCKKKKNSL